jgi:lipopolysaccharide transport system permease protein
VNAAAPPSPGPFAAARAAVALSWRIFRRTIGAKYRKSFLGYFWMVAPALLITGGVVLASDAGVVDPGSSPLPAMLSVFLGTLLWQVFAEAVDVPYQAFEGARSYLTRVYFSRAAVLVLLVAFGFWHPGLALVPVAFAGAVLLGLGLGCFLMPVCQLFSDVQQTLKLVLAYGLFLTPAMYQPQSGWFAVIVGANPVSPLIVAAREAAGGAVLSQPTAFAMVIAAGVVATVAGFALVRAVAPILIERMLLGGR